VKPDNQNEIDEVIKEKSVKSSQENQNEKMDFPSGVFGAYGAYLIGFLF